MLFAVKFLRFSGRVKRVLAVAIYFGEPCYGVALSEKGFYKISRAFRRVGAIPSINCETKVLLFLQSRNFSRLFFAKLSPTFGHITDL